MNRQEIFEKVSKHLFAQGKRAYLEVKDSRGKLSTESGCRYRGPDNTSCAVGCLIPDEMYRPEMDEHPAPISVILTIAKDRGWDLPEYFWSQVDFLRKLQNCHDFRLNWGSTKEMHFALYQVAKKFELNCEFLDNLRFEDR